MKIVKSKLEVESFIKENNMLLIYFSTNTCIVCDVLKEKINKVLSNYKSIKMCEILCDEYNEIAVDFNVYSAPVAIFFIDGKEVFRESKYLSIDEFKKKIDRYNNLYF